MLMVAFILMLLSKTIRCFPCEGWRWHSTSATIAIKTAALLQTQVKCVPTSGQDTAMFGVWCVCTPNRNRPLSLVAANEHHSPYNAPLSAITLQSH